MQLQLRVTAIIKSSDIRRVIEHGYTKDHSRARRGPPHADRWPEKEGRQMEGPANVCSNVVWADHRTGAGVGAVAFDVDLAFCLRASQSQGSCWPRRSARTGGTRRIPRPQWSIGTTGRRVCPRTPGASRSSGNNWSSRSRRATRATRTAGISRPGWISRSRRPKWSHWACWSGRSPGSSGQLSSVRLSIIKRAFFLLHRLTCSECRVANQLLQFINLGIDCPSFSHRKRWRKHPKQLFFRLLVCHLIE